MSEELENISEIQKEELKRKLGPIIRKVALITFTVGLISILVGLLLDRINNTTPTFTLAVLVISIPIVLLLNARMLRREIEKMQAESNNKFTEV